MEQDWLTAADEDAKMKTLRYFGGIYGLCLKGVKHLCRDILGRSQSGKAVYAMINLFSRILESSSRLCHASAVLKIEVSEGVLLSSVSLQGRIAESPSAVSSVLSAHTQFLASIFYSKEFTLTPRPKCYTEIMEGTAAILCAKLGRLLSFAVFNEPVADSTVPGHISMHPSPDPITELAMKIEREQMDAFLRLVKHRMKEIMSSSEELVNTPQLAKLLVGDAASTVHQGKLFEMASQKLQSTLCKALFGEDDGDFPNAIDTQVWGNDETEVEVDRQPSGEDDDRTKFLNSVWQLVGWDILEKR